MLKITKLLLILIILFISYSNNSIAKPPIFAQDINDAMLLSKDLDLDVLLVFTAEWCGTCRVMKNDINNDLMLVEDKIICYINYDNNPDLVKEFKVKTIPDYMIYKNSIETKRNVGYKSKESFSNWLNKN